MKIILAVIICFLQLLLASAQNKPIKEITNNKYGITWVDGNCTGFRYTIKQNKKAFDLTFPTFEIGGKEIPAVLKNMQLLRQPVKLKNGVEEYQLAGNFASEPALLLNVRLQVAPDNAVVRFQYALSTKKVLSLTKTLSGKDNISYLSFKIPSGKIKEVRLSEFNERFHATHKSAYVLDERYFENEASFMGPIAIGQDGAFNFLAAYEHGSQYPDRFLQFQLGNNKKVTVQSVKGNYLDKQPADGFKSIWFQFAALSGSEDQLAADYRDFILRYITQNTESRKPYIFYNTWGRQERVQWSGQKYLSSMNLDQTLKEIDRAHAMGIEVFVIDAGWFKKTGDWEVNKELFPDELKQVKARIEGYGMKLGLWFNPTVAAVSSAMYIRNLANRMSQNGTYGEPSEIWETEKSVGMCLVSSYWEDFANKLIALNKELGVSYFKWDAIGQYGCNDATHYHGNTENTLDERTQRYAFLQPEYMARIIDKVCKAAPESIFDFDITEDGRCVGLQFLSAGKYFIINNGPYYHNYDLAPLWKSVLPNGNANIFVQPGPARGWFVRSVLNYDKWIPSVLFLTHYQPDEPRNSQLINLASLILGQNGVWGEILKTSDEGVRFFDTVLSKYKLVREDITKAQMIYTGEPGGSPEIYEKINTNGKGCVVIFANAKGTYKYITENRVATSYWNNDGVKFTTDKKGRANITVEFDEPSAKIIFFK